MGYRVVIGDDESIIRLDLCEMLEEAGHVVVGEAADGVEALELARKEKPDIVLLDIKIDVYKRQTQIRRAETLDDLFATLDFSNL